MAPENCYSFSPVCRDENPSGLFPVCFDENLLWAFVKSPYMVVSLHYAKSNLVKNLLMVSLQYTLTKLTSIPCQISVYGFSLVYLAKTDQYNLSKIHQLFLYSTPCQNLFMASLYLVKICPWFLQYTLSKVHLWFLSGTP